MLHCVCQVNLYDVIRSFSRCDAESMLVRKIELFTRYDVVEKKLVCKEYLLDYSRGTPVYKTINIGPHLSETNSLLLNQKPSV